MVTVTIRRTARIEPALGLGPRATEAVVYAASGERVYAKDVNLRTITGEPSLTSRELNYYPIGSVNSPGSLGNYFVVQWVYTGTSGPSVEGTGSHYANVIVGGE